MHNMKLKHIFTHFYLFFWHCIAAADDFGERKSFEESILKVRLKWKFCHEKEFIVKILNLFSWIFFRKMLNYKFFASPCDVTNGILFKWL